MPDEVTSGLGAFFDTIWRDTDAYVYLASMAGGDPQEFKQYMQKWPQDRDGIIRHVLKQSAEGRDVYFSPALYRERARPTKENVLGSWVHWADFDGSAPSNWKPVTEEAGIPEPAIRVQSSVEGHEHVYWQLDTFQSDRDVIEDGNRAIAYRLGADTSGWDVDQLLRPPFTANYGHKNKETRKGWYQDKPSEVQCVSWGKQALPQDTFAGLGTPERELIGKLHIDSVPPIREVMALTTWSEDFFNAFNMTKEEASASSPDKRSGAIMRLGYFAVENGLTDEQVYSVLDDADKRWDKYTKRSKAGRHKLLLDIIARARAKHGYVDTGDLTFAGLLGAAGTAPDKGDKIVFSFDEFLKHEVHLEWLIEGFLTQGGLAVITAQPGVGKTQLATQLGITLALGMEDFLIWKNIAGQKKVFLLSLEMPHAPLKSFVAKMARQYEDMLTLDRNMHIAPIGQPVPLNTKQGQQFLDNLLNEYRPDILLVDSLQKISSKPLTDEQGAKDLMTYLSTMRKKHGCTVTLVHHNRKRTADGRGAGDLSEMFGNQFLAAEMDVVANLRAIGGTSIVSVDCWKNRLEKMWPTFDIERNENLQYALYTGDSGGGIFIGPDSPSNGEGGARLSF